MTAVEQPVTAEIGLRELLEAIEVGDVGWSDRLGAHTLAELAAAVDQQIRAGNLEDGLTLTPQGRATLARLRRLSPQGSVPSPARDETDR